MISAVVIFNSTHLYATCIIYNQANDRSIIDCIAAIPDLTIIMGEERDSGLHGRVSNATLQWHNEERHAVVKEVRLRSVSFEEMEARGYHNDEKIHQTAEDVFSEYLLMQRLYKDPVLGKHLVCPYAFFVRTEGEQQIATIVMEDGGEPLTSLIRTRQYDDESFHYIASSLAAILKEFHKHRLVHLDLHPGNILIDRFNTIKIIDFGLTRMVNQNVSVGGNVEYRDPSLPIMKRAYVQNDYFSLGAILFELATGKTLFNTIFGEQNRESNFPTFKSNNFQKFEEGRQQFLVNAKKNQYLTYALGLMDFRPKVRQTIFELLSRASQRKAQEN